jgi:hypothetical protein
LRLCPGLNNAYLSSHINAFFAHAARHVAVACYFR